MRRAAVEPRCRFAAAVALLGTRSALLRIYRVYGGANVRVDSAAALSVSVLSAQPLVAVASVSDSLSGLTLIGASDPVYLPAVSALIGASALPPYEPMFPFSVLVYCASAHRFFVKSG